MSFANRGANTWLIACHWFVLGAAVTFIFELGLPPLATAAAIVLGTAPLTLAVKGLMRESTYTQLWLAIAMVFYIGTGLVETIAAQAMAPGAVFLLLASVLELALLLVALKNARRGSHGSVES
jgi:uncharacterized membrane protein